MNIILILIDSLNKDCLSIYNPQTICKTPNIDRLSKRCAIYDNHFISSLPCMPARREIFAGRKEFMWRPWGPLELFDPRLPQIVAGAGYNTGIVTDHYHYWEEMANGYIQGFQSLTFVRGHETDNWKVPIKDDAPAWVKKMSEFRAAEHMEQYYANVKDFKTEEDFFPAKVFSGAADWLEENASKGPFFLQVESFDVHEPFHVPEPYTSMYTDGNGSKDDFNIWPPYQVYAALDAFMEQTSPEELAFLKAQYMGKTTMVDNWLGTLLDKVSALDLWDETMIVLTTDHGHDLGQRGIFGKQFPHYDSHANIPMVVWHPEHTGSSRVGALTQTVDIFSTVIEAAGATPPEEPRHSRSIMPTLTGTDIREAILYGTYGQGVCLTDGEWTLFKAPVEGKPLFNYSTMINRPLIVDNPVDGRVGALPEPPADQGYFDPTVPMPLWKIPINIDPRTHENFLFNRKRDPNQEDNLWEKEPAQRDRLVAKLCKMIEEEGAPPEQFERLGLV
ncbi:MAG: sulfatase [Stappiaceae bacterium]